MSRTAEQKEEINLVDVARKMAYKIRLSVWTLPNWQCWLPPRLLQQQHLHTPQRGLSFELRRIVAFLLRCLADGTEDVAGNVMGIHQMEIAVVAAVAMGNSGTVENSNEVVETDIAVGLEAGWHMNRDSKEDRNVAAVQDNIDHCSPLD